MIVFTTGTLTNMDSVLCEVIKNCGLYFSILLNEKRCTMFKQKCNGNNGNRINNEEDFDELFCDVSCISWELSKHSKLCQNYSEMLFN